MMPGKAERAGRHVNVPNEGVQEIATTGVPADFDPPSAALVQPESPAVCDCPTRPLPPENGAHA